MTAITVEITKKGQPQPTAKYTFTDAWSSTYHTNFSDWMEGGTFIPEIETTVTLTFDRNAESANIGYRKENDSDWTGQQIFGTDTVTGTVVPYTDYLDIQAAGGNPGPENPLRLLKIEVTQKAEPLKKMTNTWGSDGSEYVLDVSQCMKEEGQEFAPGVPATVTMIFDREVTAMLGYNNRDTGEYADEISAESGLRQTITVTPKDGYLRVMVNDLKGSGEVNLLRAYITQPQDADAADPAEEALLYEEAAAEEAETAPETGAAPDADEDTDAVPGVEPGGESQTEDTEPEDGDQTPDPGAEEPGTGKPDGEEEAIVPDDAEEKENGEESDASGENPDASGDEESGDAGSEADIVESTEDASGAPEA